MVASVNMRTAKAGRAALAGVLLALTGAPAAGEGINLSWDDCGLHGAEIRAFACNTNSGAHEAVASFVPPAGVDQFMGLEAEILIATQGDLPDWWQHGNGYCRGTPGLAAGFDFTAGPSSCVDPWQGQAVGGYAYDVAYGGPNRARLRVVAATPPGNEQPVDPELEYYAFRMRFLHSRTTGTASCGGCDLPVQLTLNSIRLDQPAAVGENPLLTTPADRTVIFWQNAFGPLPEIHAMSPAAGPPGTSVTITGARFTGITSVQFHTQEASYNVISDAEISTAVPAGARTGIVHVQGPEGIGNSSGPFIVAPEIAGFSPPRGPVGFTVVLTGVNFTATTSVEFTGISAQYSVDTDTRILAVVPAGATDGPITVVNAGGSDVTDAVFEVGPVPIPGDGAINLSWDDCGIAGAELKSFACNTNSGSAFTLVGSFGAPENITQFIGALATLEITTSEPVLPDWWSHGSGQCRGQTGLASNPDFSAGPFSCVDPWQGMAVGGHAYDIGYGGPEHARLRVVAALPTDLAQALTPGSQYYAFKVLLLRSKTSGAGSCAGCDASACISLQQLQLTQRPEQGYDPVITYPGDRNYVYWQSSTGIPVCPASTPPPPPLGVPTAVGPRLSLDRAFADPGGRSVSLSVTFADDRDARLEVFDSSGRRRMSRTLAGVAAGRHEVQIAAPDPLASGMYFARVVQNGRIATRSFAVTR